ncbi:MAG: hypothetical protein H6686_11305 [Fibrobacteria bacterium]|nr:hypothetical protein [Fibrobacteria bacterium]
MKDKLIRWSPLLLIALVGSLPFLGFLFTGKMLYGSDQIGGFGNFVQYQKAIRSFQIPGWHPWYLSGMPTLDAIAGDLPYPLFWLVALVAPAHKILGLMMWSHVLLAGFGGYLLLRKSFQLDRWTSTALGAAWMLNMNILSIIHGGHTAKVYIQAWLPFGIHFLIQSLGPKARFWHPLGLAVTTALMVSTSHLQMTYYALIAYGIYLLWRLWEIFREEGPLARRIALASRKAGIFWGAILLGVGLALPVLYPPMKYVKEFSVRNTQEKTSFEHATSWSLHPEEIGALAFPEFAGINEKYWGRNPFKLNSEYAGIVLTVLGLAAAFAIRSRWSWFWASIALLSLLNGLGAHTPFYRLIYDLNVPGIRNFRAASMVMFLWAGSLLALSALWIQHLEAAQSWKEPRRALWSRNLWIATASVAGVFLLCALAPSLVHDLWPSNLLEPSWQAYANWPNAVEDFRLGAFRTAILGAGVLALSSLRISGSLPAPGMAVGLLLVSLLDLLPLAGNFVKTFHHDEYYAPEPLLENLAKDPETFRVADLPGSVTSGALMLYDLQTMGGFADNEMAHMQEFRGRDWQRTMQGLAQSPDGTVGGSRILDLLNVKYLLYRQGNNAPMGAAVNRTVLPRARLVDQVRAMPLEAQLAGVLDSSFDHRRQILVDPSEVAGNPILETIPQTASDSTPVGSVAWANPDPDHWTYSVEAARPAVLVLSEPWYPAWKVRIDGQEAPLLRVDYALRGVAVPAGKHEVSLFFHSEWVAKASRGMWLAFLALLVWAGSWWFLDRRGKSVVS